MAISIVIWGALFFVMVYIELDLIGMFALLMIFRSILLTLTTTVDVSDSGVLVRKRLLWVSEQFIPLQNIHTVSTRIGPLGALFDYGTIRLAVGNDRSTVKVNNLEGAEDLKTWIRTSRSSSSSRSSETIP